MGRDLRRYRAPRCPESGPRKSRSIPRKEVPHSEIREHKAMTDVVRTKETSAVLDLQLIHSALESCAKAVQVLGDMCRHAGLRMGAETAEQMRLDVNKAIAECERFVREVRG